MRFRNAALPAAVLVAYLAWVGAWGLCQAIADAATERQDALALFAFTIGYCALAGVLVPLAIIAGFRLALADRAPNGEKAAGTVAFALALGLGLFGSGAAVEVAAAPPAPAILVKYVLLFAPMALAISLFAFYLVPATCRRLLGERWTSGVAAAVLSALALGVGFWADQRLATTDLAVIQAVLGLIIGAGVWLSRSFAAATVTYFAIMLTNTLAEAKYVAYPWTPIVSGFVLSAAIAACFVLCRSRATPGAGR